MRYLMGSVLSNLKTLYSNSSFNFCRCLECLPELKNWAFRNINLHIEDIITKVNPDELGVVSFEPLVPF